ncbi:VOC family protein [Burkholderia anthina]|uniref:VOC family protein n=1 Tax=Burkholderia anthina TaxID=179879 RepID=UPI001FC8E63F|nr:VOC family protein [Burkholderia anthina]
MRIYVTSIFVDDLDAEFARLDALGVRFTLAPMDAGPVRVAVLDDTCGNLVQLMQMK